MRPFAIDTNHLLAAGHHTGFDNGLVVGVLQGRAVAIEDASQALQAEIRGVEAA